MAVTEIIREIIEVVDRGPQGKSAYQSAVDNGFVGTEADWIAQVNTAAAQGPIASAAATAAAASATNAAASAASAAASAATFPTPVASTFLQRNAGNSAYDTKTVQDVRNALDAAPYVADRAALKALDTTKDTVAYQIGVGWFEWTLGDFSTHQAADTAEAIYVAANGISNTVGCWVLARAGRFGLIGQGALTYANYLSYPAAIGGRHYAIAGQISAGIAAAGDKVGVYGAAETGSSGSSDVWGGNFLAQWNSGHPDVNVQTIEVDFNNRSVDQPHVPTKLKVGINVTSGGTKIPGYGYYLDASNKPTNAWRQGFVINDGAVLDTGVNVGMLAYSATFAGRQISDGGDALLLQRRTDTSPTGYFARFLNFANTLNMWTVAVDGTTNIGPKAVAGSKLHVSQEDNTATTEFTALGLEGNSAANSTGKSVSANFYGRDTTNARKQVAAVKAIPLDGNWVNSALAIYTRVADAVVEVARLGANQLFSLTGSLSRGAPVTKTASFTLADTENWVVCNGTATISVTLPAASSYVGREVMVKTIAAFTVVSASSNVVPLAGGAAGTAILAATVGKWVTLVSDGSNWVAMQGN